MYKKIIKRMIVLVLITMFLIICINANPITVSAQENGQEEIENGLLLTYYDARRYTDTGEIDAALSDNALSTQDKSVIFETEVIEIVNSSYGERVTFAFNNDIDHIKIPSLVERPDNSKYIWREISGYMDVYDNGSKISSIEFSSYSPGYFSFSTSTSFNNYFVNCSMEDKGFNISRIYPEVRYKFSDIERFTIIDDSKNTFNFSTLLNGMADYRDYSFGFSKDYTPPEEFEPITEEVISVGDIEGNLFLKNNITGEVELAGGFNKSNLGAMGAETTWYSFESKSGLKMGSLFGDYDYDFSNLKKRRKAGEEIIGKDGFDLSDYDIPGVAWGSIEGYIYIPYDASVTEGAKIKIKATDTDGTVEIMSGNTNVSSNFLTNLTSGEFKDIGITYIPKIVENKNNLMGQATYDLRLNLSLEMEIYNDHGLLMKTLPVDIYYNILTLEDLEIVIDDENDNFLIMDSEIDLDKYEFKLVEPYESYGYSPSDILQTNPSNPYNLSFLTNADTEVINETNAATEYDVLNFVSKRGYLNNITADLVITAKEEDFPKYSGEIRYENAFTKKEPKNLRITEVNNDGVLIEWEHSGETDKSAPKKYDIYYRQIGYSYNSNSSISGQDFQKIVTISNGLATHYFHTIDTTGVYEYYVIETDYLGTQNKGTKHLFSNDYEGMPPTPELRVVGASEEKIKLEWDANISSYELTNYHIYRQLFVLEKEYDGYTQISFELEPSFIGSTRERFFTDDSIRPNGVYKYFVRAQAKNTFSNFSDPVEVKALDTVSPTTPEDIRIYSEYNPDATVILDWTPSTDGIGVTEYEIYRQTANDDGSFNQWDLTTAYARVEGGITAFVDKNVDIGKKYAYKVIAKDKAGNASLPSEQAAIMIGNDNALNEVKVIGVINSFDGEVLYKELSITPEFNGETTEYAVAVPEYVSSFKIYTIPTFMDCDIFVNDTLADEDDYLVELGGETKTINIKMFYKKFGAEYNSGNTLEEYNVKDYKIIIETEHDINLNLNTTSITKNEDEEVVLTGNIEISGEDFSEARDYYTVTVDYGDSVFKNLNTLMPYNIIEDVYVDDNGNFKLTHIYDEAGKYSVEVKVTDTNGNTISKICTVQVIKNAPKIKSNHINEEEETDDPDDEDETISDNADLDSLTFSGGFAVNPSFTDSVTEYNLSAGFSGSIEMTAITEDENSQMTYSVQHNTSGLIDMGTLESGVAVTIDTDVIYDIYITVMAQDGSTKEYTIHIN